MPEMRLLPGSGGTLPLWSTALEAGEKLILHIFPEQKGSVFPPRGE